MPGPLDKQIAAVRRRTRALTWGYALAWTLAVVLAAIIVAGLLDYLLRFHDAGLRLIATLAVAGVAVWALWRYLRPAATARFRDLDLAIRIERRFPQLKDRLASAVAFSSQAEEDPEAGSPALRRAVIAQTAAEVQRLRLADAINFRPTLAALALAAAVSAVAATLFLLDPTSSRTALSRLAQPWAKLAWPQRTHLAFRDEVTRLASGADFEVHVVDRRDARLPDEVELQLRYAGEGEIKEESMRFVDGAMVFRRENVQRPFEYRAVGGDDRGMPWLSLEIVEPPQLERFAATIHPPEYTAWSPSPAARHIRALKGSRITFRGSSDKPLKSATLVLESGEEYAAAVGEDGYEFAFDAAGEEAFVVQSSGAYRVRLTDREGFSGRGERWEIRAESDLPPEAQVVRPEADLYVTAVAEIPLLLRAQDDLAVRSVELRYLRSDQTEGDQQVVRLLPPEGEAIAEKPETPTDPEAPTGLAAKGAAPPVEIEYLWRLADLKLSPGTQITFHAAATDFLPQEGISPARRLTIIGEDELFDRLAERQTSILAELARILEIQRQSRGQLGDVEVQLEEVGRPAKPDLDRLQGADLTQRQVNRALTSPTEGVQATIGQLLADLKNNKVDSPEIERRMNELLQGIEQIQRDHLPPITAGLTAAIKMAQSELAAESPPDDETAVALKENIGAAGAHQDQTIAALEAMLGEMTQWDNYRRFYRELTGVRREAEEIIRQTAEVARETITRDFRDLTPQQQADLKKLSRRQEDLARRLDNLGQQMEAMSGELAETDPLAAGVLSDAIHHARNRGLSGKMRQAGQSLERNQVGQATQAQRQANEDLGEMLDILANRRESELSRLVKKLREAERELADIRQRQSRLRKKMAESEGEPDEEKRRRELERLRREQQQLQEETERFSRKLQRLRAEQSGSSAARAGRRMQQAGSQAGEGDAGEAGKTAEKALEDLEDAQRQLAQERRQAEADLAMEQLAKIEDALVGLRDRQQSVVDETLRLAELLDSQGRLSRGQRISLGDLARTESALEEETRSLAEKLAAAEVFSLALKGAAREMELAADLLEQEETGESTLAAERNALRRFEQMLLALKPDERTGEGGNSQAGQPGGQGGEQGGDGIPQIAQLKVLKMMQEEINERTAELQSKYGRLERLDEPQRREVDLVGQQQGELADLALNLSRPTEPDPEDDPEKLPDFDLEDLEELDLGEKDTK